MSSELFLQPNPIYTNSAIDRYKCEGEERVRSLLLKQHFYSYKSDPHRLLQSEMAALFQEIRSHQEMDAPYSYPPQLSRQYANLWRPVNQLVIATLGEYYLQAMPKYQDSTVFHRLELDKYLKSSGRELRTPLKVYHSGFRFNDDPNFYYGIPNLYVIGKDAYIEPFDTSGSISRFSSLDQEWRVCELLSTAQTDHAKKVVVNAIRNRLTRRNAPPTQILTDQLSLAEHTGITVMHIPESKLRETNVPVLPYDRVLHAGIRHAQEFTIRTIEQLSF